VVSVAAVFLYLLYAFLFKTRERMEQRKLLLPSTEASGGAKTDSHYEPKEEVI
jgi:hypothetical protein